MRDDELDPAEAEIVRRLRALPPEGVEPDWSLLEKSIREAVGPVVHVPWWRRARWLVPMFGLATTAAAALLWIRHPEKHVVTPDAATSAPAAEPAFVYVGGDMIDVGALDDAPVLDDPVPTVAGEDDEVGLLPASDLGWIDSLDDGAVDRAEHWLEKKKT